MELNEATPHDARFKLPDQSKVEHSMSSAPTLVRWYIDTREWEDNGWNLPLLETLNSADQANVRKFVQPADKRHALASCILKYLFIHHVYDIPWDNIRTQRTPDHRPCFSHPENPIQIDFNVSHQASLVILAGTVVPGAEFHHMNPEAPQRLAPPRVGIDITCVDEPNRRRHDRPPKTMETLLSFIKIFEEVFSEHEMYIMSRPLHVWRHSRGLEFVEHDWRTQALIDEESLVRYGLRLFYSYWALKEAYIKMTGEALLAPWLRRLEFFNVIPPEPVNPLRAPRPYGPTAGASNPNFIPSSPRNWSKPHNDVHVTMDGKLIDDTVRMQLVAFESDYIVATAARGDFVGPIAKNALNDPLHHLPGIIRVREGLDSVVEKRIPLCVGKRVGYKDPWRLKSAISDPWLPMQEVDINLDVRACSNPSIPCSHKTDPDEILPDLSA
ncbi:hypothetical protein NUU61_008738 [Penicillium alfredii]|uniref:holo-[acyl-carrier-protein] synthase n=1 Tax=Penicillium alfredii TaxID=1506179 RepID=A0A9W9EM09_9EURO|nr:uncharacterized protein NUU61_008738 [Penicillium alfredii]KAJ5084159.1 hypothetical protein NUU61_008738 [Penicillium alfredii]